jgi:hypothetical protein
LQDKSGRYLSDYSMVLLPQLTAANESSRKNYFKTDGKRK